LSDIQSETEPALPESLQFLIDKEIIDRYMAQLHSKFKGDIYVLNGLWLENLSEIIAKGAQ
jgi:hypothetical protein